MAPTKPTTKAPIPLPQYQCHKLVRAAKILRIRPAPADGQCPELVLAIDGFEQVVPVSTAFLDKYVPQVGGYLVVYDDGYRSFSPAAAFEAGYTRLEA
jgi:hypothetical protein